MRGLILLIFALALATQFDSVCQAERTAPQNRSEVLTIRVNQAFAARGKELVRERFLLSRLIADELRLYTSVLSERYDESEKEEEQPCGPPNR
jgi:hypothetical protein